MHEPYISIYINNNALHFVKKLPNETCSREIFDVPLDQVMADNFDEASKK